MTIKCEKCGVQAWGAVQDPTQIIRLLGGHMAELCLPCQRAWNRLVQESPEYLQLKRVAFFRELLLAQAQGRDLDSFSLSALDHKEVIEKIEAGNRHFMDLSEKWLAEKPEAEALKS